MLRFGDLPEFHAALGTQEHCFALVVRQFCQCIAQSSEFIADYDPSVGSG
jgi:hypothetical protein